MIRNRGIIKTTIVIVFIFIATIFVSHDSYADVNNLYKKNLLNNLPNCYNSSYFYAGPIVVGSLKSNKDLKDLEYESFHDNMLTGKSDGKILLPTKIKNTFDAEQKMNCEQLFDGDAKMIFTTSGEATGLFELAGVTPPTSGWGNSEKESFIKKMGYTNEENINVVDSSKQCYSFSYTITSLIEEGEMKLGSDVTAPMDAGKVCWNIPSGEKIKNYDISENAEVTMPASNGWDYDGRHIGIKIMWVEGAGDSHGGALVMHCVTDSSLPVYDDDEWSQCMASFKTYISLEDNEAQYAPIDGGDPSNIFSVRLDAKNEESNSDSYTVKQFSIKDNSFNSACAEARKKAFGDSAADGRDSARCDNEEVTAKEKKELYDYYLLNVYGIKTSTLSECIDTKPSSGYYIPALKDGKKQWCPIGTGYNKYEKVTAYTDDENYVLNTVVDLEGLLKLYNNLELDIEDLEEIEKIIEGIEKKEYDDKVEEASKMDPCFSKANSVGWILCPVIEILSDTTENLYTWIEDDFLSIEAGFFTGRDQASLYGAWSGFVGIANIILVVFFLIIVFSQLTGIGIDNYGIKKTLPKIIVAAILINLSYYICELAVDVSNILGRALNDWFTAMGQGLPLIDLNASDEVNTHAGLFSALKSLISGGIIATTAVTAVNAFQSGGFVAILLPLLAALVIALVAIFFFFILLGLRKAGVIILIAISPLAFVCYMLPNTKPLFSKWVKALKGLLILYPICGLLIGGGFYVSRMLMSLSSDYFMRFVAMMLTVVPFFFIPKLLTSSFAAMGNIGAKITSLGRGLGRRTSSSLDKGIRGTNRFKARQNDWDMRNNYRLSQAKTRRAQRTIDGLSGRNDLSAAERMRLAQANQIRQGERDMQTKAYESQFSNYGKPEMQDELIKAFGGNDGNEMMAAISTAENGKMDEQLLNALYQSNTRGFSEDILQRLSKSANGVVSAYAKEQLKRGASERKSFSDFVNNNTDVKSDTNSLHAYQQGKGSNWVTGMNDDTLKFINSKNQHAFEANALLNAASQTQNLKELNPLNDMIRASGITDPSMITGKMLEGMDESTAKVIGGALLQDAWADIVKGNREANVSGAVRDVIDSARTVSSRPPVDPRYGSSGMDESGF